MRAAAALIEVVRTEALTEGGALTEVVRTEGARRGRALTDGAHRGTVTEAGPPPATGLSRSAQLADVRANAAGACRSDPWRTAARPGPVPASGRAAGIARGRDLRAS